MLAVAVLLARGVVAGEEPRTLLVDPMEDLSSWQLGGHRIYYTLGASALVASGDQLRPGARAALKLIADFAAPGRSYVSAYHVGGTVPGVCQRISFWVYGPAADCRLRLSLEDARGRWFERDLGAVDWQGWRKLEVPVGQGENWRALARLGESPLPLLHPVNLRQIALYRGRATRQQETLYLHDLRAESLWDPADAVDAVLSTGREGNLFDVGERPILRVVLHNTGRAEVQGRLTAVVNDFFGNAQVFPTGAVRIPGGNRVVRPLTLPADRLGAYRVKLVLRSGARERVWFHRYAVTRPRRAQPPDAKAVFGCCGNVDGFDRERLPVAARLNRDAGIR
ncbi:MAG: flagellar filament outer layer protein FlaA, partial [Armatimonadota bacterium]|nr:flagellar filament outer layer protein FlaA [Armatimonadota bacterium]